MFRSAFIGAFAKAFTKAFATAFVKALLDEIVNALVNAVLFCVRIRHTSYALHRGRQDQCSDEAGQGSRENELKLSGE